MSCNTNCGCGCQTTDEPARPGWGVVRPVASAPGWGIATDTVATPMTVANNTSSALEVKLGFFEVVAIIAAIVLLIWANEGG